MKPTFINPLDAERFGIKLNPEPVPSAPPKDRIKYRQLPCDKQHFTEQIAQRYFAAGRFAAGARDRIATEGHEWLMAELEKAD